jgi:hypothetical protein
MESAHRWVASVETSAHRIIPKTPVNRCTVHEFNGFEFNARSPFGFKLEAKGDAEGDVVGKNHGIPFGGLVIVSGWK